MNLAQIMSKALSTSGQSNEIGSAHSNLGQDSQQLAISKVDQSTAEVPAQELSDDQVQTASSEEAFPARGLKSLPSRDKHAQDTSSSSPSSLDADNTGVEIPVVEDYAISNNQTIGTSDEARSILDGAVAEVNPFLDGRTHNDVSEISQHHDTETVDDIRFPEYLSYTNDEFQGRDDSQEIQTKPENVEPANQASVKTAAGLHQDLNPAGDEVYTSAGNAFPSLSSLNRSHAEENTNYESDLKTDYFSRTTDAENADFFTQLDEYQGASTIPTDEEARFDEGLPLVPRNSIQVGTNVRPDPLKGHEEASLNWSHEINEDFLGENPSSSPTGALNLKPVPLERKTTTQVLDSLNYSADDPTYRGLSPADKSSQAVVEESPRNMKSSQSEAENQAVPSALGKGSFSMTQEAQEEDLAAKWREFLGDDDLLEEDESSFDPSNFFKDHREEFLENSHTQMPETTSSSSREAVFTEVGNMQVYNEPKMGSEIHGQSRTSGVSMSQRDVAPVPVSNYNIPTAPSPLTQSYFPFNQAVSNFTGFQAAKVQSPYSSNAPLTRPQLPESVQSFSDKSKGGYTSPYDLPMDVTLPKKRTYVKQTQTPADSRVLSNPPPPPPRTSSISSSITPPTIASYPMSQSIPAANATRNYPNSQPLLARAATAITSSRPSTGSFFEELLPKKPRPADIRSRPLGTAQVNQIPHASSERGPPQQTSLPRQPNSASSGASQGYQLVPPERMALFSHAHDESLNKVPAISSRYSPAPASHNVVPGSQNRYAFTSGPRPHQPPHSMSFQPRNSSPLAQSSSVSQHHQRSSAGDVSRIFPGESHILDPSVPHNAVNPQYKYNGGGTQPDTSPQAELKYPKTLDPTQVADTAIPDNRYAHVGGIPSMSPYAPQQVLKKNPPPKVLGPVRALPVAKNQIPLDRPAEVSNFEPPRRSQTQSPGAVRSKPEIPFHVSESIQRPASTNLQATPTHPRSAYIATSQQEAPSVGKFSQDLNYIVPSDGREHDPLERWKGCPILTFGFGGLSVTSFPKKIPRYSAGQTTPMIKCSPGEVTVRVGKTLRLDESIASFPGPLRSKSKKKDVLDWLQKRVVHLENLYIPGSLEVNSSNLHSRAEEQILLWKCLQIFVEHDGAIDGNNAAITAVRSLLTSGIVSDDYSLSEGALGISSSGGPKVSSKPSDGEVLESIRKLLLGGEREKAVWYAVDQRMWDHAMLLSSTLQPTIWKQVLREFIRQEVRTSAKNTESLASLYQVFAGNWEESIDELVPSSARAGLQMVSISTGAGPPKNALEGLDRWRETLTLILNNRSQDDTKALVALGRLLSSYGRSEAAHICYIFGKTPGHFGGADDPQAAIALLGGDHHNYPVDYDRDFNNILLTEVYEFATNVLAPSTGAGSPHLQAYKLYHAIQLADYGFKSEAQQYCDVITTAMKSTTKLSPYYHSLFFGALEDLVERLRQAPRDESHSWISKPSMDKVSGSVWAKFNQFIAGDESDTNSAVSGKALDQDANRPFALLSGDSPSLSRTPSSNDMYSGYQPGGAVARSAPTTVPNSRYALTGQYTPRSSLEQSRSLSQEPRQQSEVDGQRSLMSHAQYPSQQRSASEIQHRSTSNPYKQPPQPSSYSSQKQSYLPTPPSQPEYAASPIEVPLMLNEIASNQPKSYLEQPSPAATKPPVNEIYLNTDHDTALLGSNQPSSTFEASTTNSSPLRNTEEQLTDGYNPSLYRYEPPSNTDDPPSYDPETTNDPDSPLEKPKRKTFGDDDDDDDGEFVKPAAALLKEDRARKDREADEVVRKAAEADGKVSLSFLMIEEN